MAGMEEAVRGGVDGPCRCGQSVGMMCRRKKKRISDVFDASGPRRRINGRREGWRNHPEKPFQTPGGGPQYSSGEPPHIFFFRSLHESPSCLPPLSPIQPPFPPSSTPPPLLLARQASFHFLPPSGPPPPPPHGPSPSLPPCHPALPSPIPAPEPPRRLGESRPTPLSLLL